MFENGTPQDTRYGGPHAVDVVKPLVALVESGTTTLALNSRELGDRTIAHLQAVMAEFDHCLEAIRQESDPVGMARCYSRFMMNLGLHNVSQAADAGHLLLRAGTAMLMPQVDGSPVDIRL